MEMIKIYLGLHRASKVQQKEPTLLEQLEEDVKSDGNNMPSGLLRAIETSRRMQDQIDSFNQPPTPDNDGPHLLDSENLRQRGGQMNPHRWMCNDPHCPVCAVVREQRYGWNGDEGIPFDTSE